MTDTNQEHVLPEGRLINHSLFVKDQFNDKSTPQYKAEIAYEAGALDDFVNEMLDFAVEKWGEGADGNVILPVVNGDTLAAKREDKGKDGSAYKGMEVLRPNTIYNRHGEDADGGITVFDEDVKPILPIDQSSIYQGCMGQVKVVMGAYVNNDGNNAITLYMNAFMKTGDGERLVSQRDHSSAFKPVGRKVKTSTDDSGEKKTAGRRR